MTTSENGMSVKWSVGLADQLNSENPHQAWAKSALRTIALHLDGISEERAMALRKEYCDLAPKAKETVVASARGGVSKSKSSADFVANRIFPPLLLPLLEAAERVSQLKMLGAMKPELTLTVNMVDISARHADKFKNLLTE